MLGVINLKIPGLGKLTERMENQAGKGYWGVFLLGVVFALAFCPYSGVLYFVMLIPMTVASAQGLYLPFVFAIATGLPVILFAWMIAYAVGSVGSVYNKIKVFELWFRRVVAVLFIGVGIYYIVATMIL
jgi:threonine/homoserine/homoserine lactone efflux protein